MMVPTGLSSCHATTHSVVIALLNFERDKETQALSYVPTAATIHNSQQMEYLDYNETFILRVVREK